MLSATIILFAISVFFYGLYYQYCSFIVLWIGVVISFIAVVLGVLKCKRETGKILSVILFLISLRTLAMWRTKPWGFTIETDSSFGLQLSNLMNEMGKWFLGMGFEREIQYSAFPALHNWTVMLAKITGLNTVFVAQFLLPILSGSLIIVFCYLATRSMLTRRVATWASLILCLNPRFVFFDATYVHESFALVFYAMYLFVVFHVYFVKRSKRRLMVIGMLAAFVTAFAHHWTAYNLIIISIIFFCFPGAYTRLINFLHSVTFRRARTISIGFVIATFTIVFTWISFIAVSILTTHTKMAWYGFFVSLVNPAHPLAERLYPTMEIYTLQEKIMISLGVLVLIIIGTTELLVGMFRKEKTASDFIFESWFIFSSVFILSISFLSPAAFGREISYRSWVFAFFGLSPLMAKNIVKKGNVSRRELIPRIQMKKSIVHLKPLVLIFPLIATVLQAPIHVRNPSLFLPDNSYYSTALWVKSYLPNETITVDKISHLVLVPYGRVQSSVGMGWTDLDRVIPAIYQSKNLSGIPEEWQIIVFNRNISTWYPDVSPNSSILDRQYNRIYDSISLTIFDAKR